ncbi:MAG TPA: ATP-binding protein [Candidatus Omnitrophota bacterium]|nr:ATP-binding protein [Candidatus Omnitrophota bacterium]
MASSTRSVAPPRRLAALSFSRTASAFVAGCSALAGLLWAAARVGVLPREVGIRPVDPVAAFGLAAAGLAIRLATSRRRPWGRLLVVACALFVAVAGVLDARDGLGLRSVSLIALSFSIAFLDRGRQRGWWPSQLATGLAGMMALVALSSYAMGAASSAPSPIFLELSAPAAVALLTLVFALYAARPDGRITSLAFDPGLAGDTIRIMTPIAVVVPFVLGWLRLRGQMAGLYGREFGVAIQDVATTSVLVVALWVSARILSRVERARAQAERGHTESERRLRMMLGVSQVGVWERDVLQNRMECDATSLRLWGFTPDAQPTYVAMIERIHPDDRDRVTREIEESLERGVEFDTTYRVVHPDRTERALGARGAVTLDPEGRPMRITGINWDVTLHQQAEEAKERAAREQIEMKDQFISHASHELRSPLSSIVEFQDILLRGLVGPPLTPEQRDCVEIAQRNAYQLRLMIDDLLEVTRAQAGKLAVSPQSFAVEGVIEDVVTALKPAATAKMVDLSHSLYEPPPLAFADPARVRQVVTNLVENAIKYTRAGGTVSISAEVDVEGENIEISIEDTGSGISPEDQVRIFEQMYQASRDSRESRKGLGLGLYICRELVTRMGGRIRVVSAVGKGSRFTFTLPLLSAASVQDSRRSA